MTELTPSATVCISRVRDIFAKARTCAMQSVNVVMVVAYWHMGREIVEEEQRGEERAEYGARLLEQLSETLTVEFGKGFSIRNLRFIRQFYLAFPNRLPSVPFVEITGGLEIRYAVSTESPNADVAKGSRGNFFPQLSWTHYRVLMRVNPVEARNFYEVECAKAGWSVRELERQIGSLLFERLARSRDKEGVMALANHGHEISKPADLVKDPYVWEFVGLPESTSWLENELEAALLERLQQFLLELGRDLFFVARQKRITIDGDHFYIDLVFYHRVLRCFLLIDLKTGKLTHQDIGQMQMYTGYYKAEEMREDENPPIGLILCTEKNDAMVRYTLGDTENQIFASRYQLYLPSEEELAEEIRRERQLLELHHHQTERHG